MDYTWIIGGPKGMLAPSKIIAGGGGWGRGGGGGASPSFANGVLKIKKSEKKHDSSCRCVRKPTSSDDLKTSLFKQI